MRVVEEFGVQSDIVVAIPVTADWLPLGRKTAKIICGRAGVPVRVVLIQYELKGEGTGWGKAHNWGIENIPSKYWVYACADYFPGRLFIKLAMQAMKGKTKLVGFNDGKWFGHIATAGIIETKYAKSIYGKGLFYEGYIANYTDVELTLIAASDDAYKYHSDAVFIENDYDKESKCVNICDKVLFNKRKEHLFEGRVKGELIATGVSPEIIGVQK